MPGLHRSLTTKLPFEDDEFDHVHVQSIAHGVPENKVSAPTIHSLPFTYRSYHKVGRPI